MSSEITIEEVKSASGALSMWAHIATVGADQEPDVLKEQRKTAVIKRLTSALESARRDGVQDKLLPAFIVQQIEDLKRKLEDQLK